MKLSLMTYGLGQELGLDEMLDTLVRHGYAGVEFRVDLKQEHGVEPELTAAERETVKAKCAEAGVAIVSIASGNRFHQQDAVEMQGNVARAKQVIQLAADLDAPLVRVFGNNFPEGVEREAVMRQVADCLSDLGDFAQPLGVDVDLEMHGEFCWREALRTAELADHPRPAGHPLRPRLGLPRIHRHPAGLTTDRTDGTGIGHRGTETQRCSLTVGQARRLNCLAAPLAARASGKPDG